MSGAVCLAKEMAAKYSAARDEVRRLRKSIGLRVRMQDHAEGCMDCNPTTGEHCSVALKLGDRIDALEEARGRR